MATITTGSGSGLLGTLGGIATIGGALIPSAQWLTPLGTALGTANNMIRGGTGQQQGNGGKSLLDILADLSSQLGGGSITGKNTQTTPQLRGSTTDEELNKMWGYNPHANGVYGLGGYNAWLR